MKRPTVIVTVTDTDGGIVHQSTRGAFNSAVRASEAAVRTVARDAGQVYEGGRPVRVGDVYRRTWTPTRAGSPVLFATVAVEIPVPA